MTDPQKLFPGSVKTFSCPNCNGTINIRALGISITAICQNCGSTIDIANEELSIIRKAAANTKVSLDLPLGTRGHLYGCDWEVIGYSERGDADSIVVWSEYLLFNPWQGFRFLVESDGHWTFVKLLREVLDGPVYNDRPYKLYSRDNAIVVHYVLGEFYWRVKVGETAAVEDYISPPYVLSCETSAQEATWSHGTYIEPALIRQAFKIKEQWPPPVGIGECQPAPAQKYFSDALRASIIAVVCLLILQIVFSVIWHPQTLLDTTIQATPAQKDTPQVTDAFEIPDKTGTLKMSIASGVSNDWLEVDASLFNETTQESDEAVKTIEYYYGYDSDGYWSEGSQSGSDTLSAVAGGNYRLSLMTDAGAFTRGQSVAYRLKLVRNGPDWSNFFTAVLFLILSPALLWIFKSSFEKKRWLDSSIALPGSMINQRKFDE